MQEFFGVSEDTWKKKKDLLLANFSIYYEYRIFKKGRNINYQILKKIGDYLPPSKKGEKRDEIYKKGIMNIIADDNIQTARNVARRLQCEDYDVMQLNHEENTIYANTLSNIKILFGTGENGVGTEGRIMEKVWCRKEKGWNKYIPLTNEEVKAFFDLYKVEKENFREYEIDVLNDYHIGLYTKEEMRELIGDKADKCYVSAREAYKAQFGFYPIKVPVYQFGAFHNETILNKEFNF
jgi:hypothetical protein